MSRRSILKDELYPNLPIPAFLLAAAVMAQVAVLGMFGGFNAISVGFSLAMLCYTIGRVSGKHEHLSETADMHASVREHRDRATRAEQAAKSAAEDAMYEVANIQAKLDEAAEILRQHAIDTEFSA